MGKPSARICLFLVLLVLPGCSFLFFYPHKPLDHNSLASEFSPRDVYFKTADGLVLHGWFFQARPVSRASILVLHGNNKNMGAHVNSFLWLINRGFSIFIFDYRGYGNSDGAPDFEGVHLDTQAALGKLLELRAGSGEKIIVFGQSLGGAIALHTVATTRYKQRIAAVVVDSAFSSYRLIAQEKVAGPWPAWLFRYPISFLLSDDYSPVKWVGRISPVPLLIMHGLHDQIVPVHHAWSLFNAASDPKDLWITTGEGHVCSMREEHIREELVEYLLEKVPESGQDYPS